MSETKKNETKITPPPIKTKPQTDQQKSNKHFVQGGKSDGAKTKMRQRKTREAPSEFTDKLINLSGINKVTTGGRRLRFKAIVVSGNGKGSVGIGVSKAGDVQEAIRKASADARKNICAIILNQNASVFYEVTGKECASVVLLKPAKQGIGVKAGGAAREVLIAAGVRNVYSKSFKSNNILNLAKATLNALKKASNHTFFNNRMQQVKKKAITETAREEKR